MNAMGHNENAIRLASLAGDAQIALDRVAKGEADAFDGWLAYGAALNEGRARFKSDELFGQWVAKSVNDNLSFTPNLHERAAAMWAAAFADELEEARAASDARTPRGLHKKWLEIKAEREKALRDEEQRQKAEADRKAAQERAEAARKQAAESAAAEADARKAAEEAIDEAEREAAEVRAAEASKAKADAEKVANEADEAAQEAAPVDPYAEARKGLSGLTREGLEDEVIGLREENGDLRAKLKETRAERDEFKARWKEATEQEMGRALGNAQRQRDTAKGRLGEELAKNARQGRRIKILEAELAEAKRALESQEFTL